MSFERLKRAFRTISFRLALWSCSFFVVGVAVSFGFAYVLVSASLDRKDHESIEMELRELEALYEVGGLQLVEQHLLQEARLAVEDTFLVRLIGDYGERFLRGADRWKEFDLSRLDTAARGRGPEWFVLPAGSGPNMLDVAVLRLADGTVLQVARPSDERDEILRRFRATVAGESLPVLLLGAAGAGMLAVWSLRPVRSLVETVKAIEAGTISARVPARRSDDELDELGRLFNRMLDRNAVLIAGMRGALDAVAHDLRTPVARIRGLAELALRSERGSEASRGALGDCVEESDQLLTMLNTLMDISEAETGTLPLRLDRVNVSALLEDTVDLYREVADEKRIVVSTAPGPELWLTADGTRLRQVLANLLDNALKYTLAGGHVVMTASQQEQTIVITVEDSGIGLTPEEMPRIWDRLYRGDQSQSERGLGLGLSLVRAIVQAHGGEVRVSSQIEVGSTFSIHLPLVVALTRHAVATSITEL